MPGSHANGKHVIFHLRDENLITHDALMLQKFVGVVCFNSVCSDDQNVMTLLSGSVCVYRMYDTAFQHNTWSVVMF